MSMEKRGVVENEGEAPQEKTAQACDKPKCCGNVLCGSDTISKMADAVAKPKEEIKDK